MGNYIYYSHRIEEEICRKLNIVRFFKTRSGLKNINASLLMKEQKYIILDDIEVPAHVLFLGPDFIINKYTLLDCVITQSPHFNLMQALQKDIPLRSTDYYYRSSKGTLDWRRAMGTMKNIEYYHLKYLQSLKEIHEGCYSPVVVYNLGNRYYIFDGKHRAALCALLGLPVHCIVVDNEIANSNLWHYMFSLLENDPSYSCHTTFHSEYLNSLTNG